MNSELRPVRILLVEDNEDDIVLAMNAFEEARLCNVIHVCRDGEEALAYLKQHPGQTSAPDLILLDINMPKMDGLQLLKLLKSDPLLRRIPVVMLTSSSREEDIVRSYDHGACSYVSKPVSFEEFRNVIQKFSLYWALVVKLP